MAKKKYNYDWIDQLVPGDILRTRSGKYRAIMQINSGGRGQSNYWFALYIKQCSWTGSCYTLFSRPRLVRHFSGPTGLKLGNFQKRQEKFFKHIGKGATCCVGKEHL